MELEQFTACVKDIFHVQDKIRSIAQEAREKRTPLKKRADELEEKVRSYMIQEDVSVCNYQDERLELKTVVRFGSLTKKSLEAALVNFFQDNIEAKRCFDSVMEFIGSKEIEVLKRLKNRKRKTSDENESQPPTKVAKLVNKFEEQVPELSDEDD
jgi:hypothetical protein